MYIPTETMFSILQLLTSAIENYDRWYNRPPTLTLESVLSEFTLDNDTLRRLMHEMNRQMDQGLIDGLQSSSISMLPSFVPKFFEHKGREGDIKRYLALDLGGTNLRVLLMEVTFGQKDLYTESRNFRIPNAVMTGTSTDLFDYIVHCIEKFIDEKNLIQEYFTLGFTFSYPCDQKCLNSAILIRWTKGFNVCDVEGRDVVQLLQETIDKTGKMRIRVVALMNDSVGTQVATAYDHGYCDLAVIIATGTNASYMEKIDNIQKLQDTNYQFDQMIIDTEWGGFGDRGEIDFVKTEYDRIVDANSVHPGIQSFDKLVAGMCMGEVMRLVLAKLARHKLLFNNCQYGLLFTTDAFHTKYISEILNDQAGRLNNTRQVLEEMGVDGFQYSDLITIREICTCISRRSANLAATAIAAVVSRLQKKSVTVGIDGSTYRFHPFYHYWLKDKIRELLPSDVEVNLVQAGDGSGKGAALVAAIAETL